LSVVVATGIVTLCDFGLEQYYVQTRNLPSYRSDYAERRFFGYALITRFLSCLVYGTWALYSFRQYPHFILPSLFVGCSVIICFVSKIFLNFLNKREEFKEEFKINIPDTFLSFLLCLYIGLAQNLLFLQIALLLLILRASSLVCTYLIFLRIHGPIHPIFSLRFSLLTLFRSAYHGLNVIVVYLIPNASILLLSVLLPSSSSLSSLGLYQIASKLVLVTSVIPASVSRFVLPRLILDFNLENKSEHILDRLRQLNKVMITVSIICFAGYFFFAETLISFSVGTKYLTVAPILKILAFSLLFRFSCSYNLYFIVTRLHQSRLSLSLYGLGLIILLNLVLVPWLGLIGGALAFSCSQFFYLLPYLLVLSLRENTPLLGTSPLPYAMLLIFMSLTAFCLSSFLGETPLIAFLVYILIGLCVLFGTQYSNLYRLSSFSP
jgi:O-antigen/teichoic acid export membrane protein